MQMDEVRIGVFNLNDAKRMSASLHKQGVQTYLKHDEQTCTRGCQVTVELWCRREDIELVSHMIQQENLKMLEGHEVQWDALEETFDTSKAMATCPACSEKFSTTLSECPSCGLNFGVS